MIKTKGVVHFTLPVSDIQRSLAFYRDILGMEVSEEREMMVFLRTGNDHFMVTKAPGPVNVGQEDTDTMCHHAFWVDGDKYDEYVEDLRSNGIDVYFEEDRPPPANFSGRRAYFHDPDKHILEIIDWGNPTK